MTTYHVEVVDFAAGPQAITQYLNAVAAEGWEVVAVVPATSSTEQRGKGGYQPVSGGATTGTQAVAAAWIFLRRTELPAPAP